MSGVVIPQKKQGLTSQIIPMATQALGAKFGGPAGAMVGQAVGNKLSGGDSVAPGAVQSTAMTRRMEQVAGPQNPAQAVDEARSALAYLPPDQQRAYDPILARAQTKARMGGIA